MRFSRYQNAGNGRIKTRERFKKYCSHSGVGRKGSGFFGFWRRFGSVTWFSNMLLRRSLAKRTRAAPKNPRSERPHYFLKRSKRKNLFGGTLKIGHLRLGLIGQGRSRVQSHF